VSRAHLLADVRDDKVEDFLGRLEQLSASPASLEEAQVAAAVRVVTSPPPVPHSLHGVRPHRVLPRRVPALSLSALSAVFAGIPTKIAFAAAAAVAATTGLAVSDNLPPAAVSALQSAAEEVGFTVEQPWADELPPEGRQRGQRAAAPGTAAGTRPTDPAAAKAAGLQKAADAPGSARAGEHKAAGLAKAAAGPANADRRGGRADAGGRRSGPPKSREHRGAALVLRGPKAQQQDPPGLGREQRLAVPLPLQVPQRGDLPVRVPRERGKPDSAKRAAPAVRNVLTTP
jgi:hypothetical protein